MTEQHLLPLQTAQVHHWNRGGFLDPALLRPLYELNRHWLELLAGPLFGGAVGPGAGRGDWERLSPFDRIAMPVAQLEPSLRSAMAHCPVALFGARFHDGSYWGRISGLYCIHEPVPRLTSNEPLDDARRAALAGFASLVFFHAWHVIQLNPIAARVLFGMSDPVASIFKEVPLPRLQQLAEAHPQTITPRWMERPLFWRMLLNAVQKGEGYFAEAGILGLHMGAADLMPFAVEDKGRKR